MNISPEQMKEIVDLVVQEDEWKKKDEKRKKEEQQKLEPDRSN